MGNIKGIKVNGTPYGLNLSKIGSFIDKDATTEEELKNYIDENSGSGGIATLVSPDGSEYSLKVDNGGELYTKEILAGAKPIKPTSTYISDLGSDVKRLYINAFYCGGLDANEHTLNYCSHNFVELTNLTENDIDLDGLSLQYSYDANATTWESLPLIGVIKSGHSFLIRGKQCSVLDSAKINVDTYDMLWDRSFSTERAQFYLCFGTDAITSNPGWTTDFSKISSRHIDLVGVKGTGNAGAFEVAQYSLNDNVELNKKLFKRYYSMELLIKPAGVNANLTSRNNSKDWTYIDLTKEDGELIPSIHSYKPYAERENKNLYYDKSKLLLNKPSIITCTFGIEATDNSQYGGEKATRCFNWVSKGLNNEYIWFKKEGETAWGEAHESINGETNDITKFYNRIDVEYGDGVAFRVHKFILRNLTEGKYYYVAGHKNIDGTPNMDLCTDVRSFVVRKISDVNSFKFVQTSDQQGFNWEEYRIWAASAKCIEDEDANNDIQFMINTGDMAQNGSRMNEWLDYFNGKSNQMNNMEEMATVGNNDLSPKETYKVPDGNDTSKVSLANFNYFYTFEIDSENPSIFNIGNNSYHIPSLYSFNYGKIHFMSIVSEIKPGYETDVLGIDAKTLYPKIKEWCEADVNKYQSDKTWTVAYCHEMPFTIITTAVTYNLPVASTEIRGGKDSSNTFASVNVPSNMRFWLSEFFQTHNIPLVLGGHKHTQSTSWPLLENITYEGDVRTVHSSKPYIVFKDTTEVKEFSGTEQSTDVLVELTNDLISGDIVVARAGEKYPSSYCSTNEGTISLLPAYTATASLYKCIMINDIEEVDSRINTPVVYAMSQATSYKHTSNKELPAENTPWLRYYFPAGSNGTKANGGQKYPFYTIWEITSDEIKGYIRKVVGAFYGTEGASDGTFDINRDGSYVEIGKCATREKDEEGKIKDIYSKPGYTNADGTEITIVIKK